MLHRDVLRSGHGSGSSERANARGTPCTSTARQSMHCCAGAQSSLLHTLDSRSLRLKPHGTPHTPKGFDEAAERDEEEIAEVEMVLEGSFLQIDNTYNKLQTLCEYIDDTEVRVWA